MAVIKIVPMPGAEGQKGDPGDTGPQGPQGPIGATGPAGADALWHYNGAWQSNASYAVGDVVTYQGQLYYTKATTTVGTLPTDTTKFDLIAAKGADAEASSGGVTPTSGTWNLNFNTHDQTLVESSPSTGTYAEYYTIGELVYFDMQYNFEHVTNYGSGFYLFNLPFTPRTAGGFANNTLVKGLLVDTTAPDTGSNVIFGVIQEVHPITLQSGGWVLLRHQNTANQMELSDVYFNDPSSLSGSQINPFSRLRMSGVYRKA
jgi:hypothetical protein